MNGGERHTIVVLGPLGMLGQMVCEYFGRNPEQYQVIPIHSPARFSCQDETSRNMYVKSALAHSKSYIFNCVGLIPQKKPKDQDFFLTNTVLPMLLAHSLRSDQVLIQPSTDCVFNGKLPVPDGYWSDDTSNEPGPYGLSKALAETALLSQMNKYKQILVIRSSIIGPYSNHGLLGWFLSQPKNATIHGYANHFWNGITTLEWCCQVEKLLWKYCELEQHVWQIASPDRWSKLDLLKEFGAMFDRKDIQVDHSGTVVSVNRFLHSDIDQVPTIREQLYNLKCFLKKLETVKI